MSAQGGPALGWQTNKNVLRLYFKNNNNGFLYKGFTANLKRRIKEHYKGVTKTTRNNGSWELIYYEAFKLEKDARREEIFLKSGKGRERLKYLLSSNLTKEGGQDGNALVSKTNVRKG